MEVIRFRNQKWQMDRCALKNYGGFCRELMIIFRNWASKCLGRLVTGFCCFYLFVNAIAPLSSGGGQTAATHYYTKFPR